MAKSEKKTGRKPPPETTRPNTFRMTPSAMVALRRLSDRLDLRSLAGAIELAAKQTLLGLERYDRHPPLSPEQQELATAAIRAAGVEPRRLGANANVTAAVVGAVLAAEHTLDCTPEQFAELVNAVRRLDWPAALWLLGRAVQG